MKKIVNSFLCLSLLIASSSCQGDFDLAEDRLPDIFESVTSEDQTFVTQKQALDIANMFMGAENPIPLTKATSSVDPGAAVIKSICKNGEPMMYAVNYNDGGFVLVGASRDYLPILAYSKTEHFDISSASGGLSMWIDETMAAVEDSGNQADSVRLSMNRLWSLYESGLTKPMATKSTNISNSTPAEIACMERCEELYDQYNYDGWNFSSLAGAQYIFEEAGQSDLYDQLCYSANFNHSSPSASVVGWKVGSFSDVCGPLLSTNWNQYPPFGDLCGGYEPGCGAIALGQVMKYYEYPSQISYGGYTFGWDSIPEDDDRTSNQSKLIRKIGEVTNMHYWPAGSWCTPEDMEDGIEYFGYNVVRQPDNYNDVKRELLYYNRPVIMLGHQNNTSIVPGNLAYIGNSHYWVVDGVESIDSNVFMCFAEWQPYDSGHFSQSYYSIDSPYVASGSSYLYYHCNWGKLSRSENAWYAFNYNQYLYSRQNFLISY